MSENTFIRILVVEDNDVTRDMMTGLLRGQGFTVIGAVDGEAAIRVIEDSLVDLALVDLNMAPMGGFEFIKYLISKGIHLPVAIITADESGDILVKAHDLGVSQVLQKPVLPDRLIQTVHRILKGQGINTQVLAVEAHALTYTSEDLMRKVIVNAADNAKNKMGGPYAALIANARGKIITEGKGGAQGRVDPIAHAEVMAIRLAADVLGTADLSDYTLYCSSEPTMVGKALIKSVGIQIVYYGLSHTDIGQLKEAKTAQEPNYKELLKDEALAMFRAAKD